MRSSKSYSEKLGSIKKPPGKADIIPPPRRLHLHEGQDSFSLRGLCLSEEIPCDLADEELLATSIAVAGPDVGE